VFYEIFVRSFYDSDGDGIGDIQGVVEKLDYLNDGDPATTDDLGVTGLWLMPISQSPSYHGYDVSDYFTIEEDYGTNEDFQRLLEEAHARGIAVIVDLVMNHTSTEHPWFQGSIRPGSEGEGWYIWTAMPESYTSPWGSEVWHDVGLRYFYGLFWSGMPDLNYRNGEVTAAMRDVIRFWLEDMGVDGFRLDAVRHLVEDGEVQANTPETHAWLQDFDRYVHALAPEALTVGEIWDETAAIAPYVPDEVDIAFEFNVAEEISTAIQLQRAGSLAETWQGVLDAYPLGQFGTFLTNHDQNRIMSELAGDIEAGKLAAGLLLTSPGVPFLYYGEEVGMRGVKPDERIRTPMQWDGSETAGFTTGAPWQALQNHVSTANVAVQTGEAASLLSTYRDLIRLRQAHPALQKGEMAVVNTNDDRLFSFLRYEGDDVVLVVFNLTKEPISGYTLSLPEGPLGVGATAELLFGDGSPIPPQLTADGGFEGYTPLPELPARSTTVIELQSSGGT
jgi:glycosidase